jgi:DNA processing protein
MDNDLLYQIALTLVPNIGDVRAKALLETFGDASSIFKVPKKQLENIDGIGTIAANSIKHFADFKICEDEIKFIEKSKITPLFITERNYPQRLLNCYDSPTILYYKGNADLNTTKIVSIVGTRSNSDYGKNICEKILEDLAEQNVLVISGLAFGIDTIAHKASLKNNLKTVGVMAHGLDKVYPAQNKLLAVEMLSQGGLLTDFMSGTNPDRQNFPRRNRIVAGMCDALIVIESSAKGGSLITAELANSYNKDVFAIPGKVTDSRSEGCNYLIRNNKATLITSAKDLLESMNWDDAPKKIKQQRELFIELTPDEKTITDILKERESIQIDELYFKSGLSSSAVAQALLMLEMQGVVASLPGKVFKLI